MNPLSHLPRPVGFGHGAQEVKGKMMTTLPLTAHFAALMTATSNAAEADSTAAQCQTQRDHREAERTEAIAEELRESFEARLGAIENVLDSLPGLLLRDAAPLAPFRLCTLAFGLVEQAAHRMAGTAEHAARTLQSAAAWKAPEEPVEHVRGCERKVGGDTYPCTCDDGENAAPTGPVSR